MTIDQFAQRLKTGVEKLQASVKVPLPKDTLYRCVQSAVTSFALGCYASHGNVVYGARSAGIGIVATGLQVAFQELRKRVGVLDRKIKHFTQGHLPNVGASLATVYLIKGSWTGRPQWALTVLVSSIVAFVFPPGETPPVVVATV